MNFDVTGLGSIQGRYSADGITYKTITTYTQAPYIRGLQRESERVAQLFEVCTSVNQKAHTCELESMVLLEGNDGKQWYSIEYDWEQGYKSGGINILPIGLYGLRTV